MKDEKYCENDWGCKPACHTQECIRIKIQEDIALNGYPKGPFERIRELETRLAWAEALLERAKFLLTVFPDDDMLDHDWLSDYEKGRKG